MGTSEDRPSLCNQSVSDCGATVKSVVRPNHPSNAFFVEHSTSLFEKCQLDCVMGFSTMDLVVDQKPILLDWDPTVKYMAAHTEGTSVSDLQIPPENCLLPRYFHLNVDKIKNFNVRSDDVWIITFPKCGTTWTQEMVWLMKNNFDFKSSKEVNTFYRVPFFEFHFLRNPDSSVTAMADYNALDLLESRQSPRVIKSHLPLSLLPYQLWTVKPKIIYVYRNPKDVAVSYFHHFELLENYTGTKDEFIKAFLQGKVLYGSFWGNVMPFWKKRNEPNVMFITFEQMKKDLKGVAQSVADFIGASIPKNLEEAFFAHLSFGSMAENPAVNFDCLMTTKEDKLKKGLKFIRKGESGVWKEELSSQEIQDFDEWSRKAIGREQFPHYT